MSALRNPSTHPGAGATLSVAQDTTARGAGGPSISAMFGVGEQARVARVQGYAVRADISADPSKLSLAKFDFAAAVGTKAVTADDRRGADALSRAGTTSMAFQSSGGLPGGTNRPRYGNIRCSSAYRLGNIALAVASHGVPLLRAYMTTDSQKSSYQFVSP